MTLNEAAFTRLLVYTGHDPARLTRAIPSLKPVTFTGPGEPPVPSRLRSFRKLPRPGVG